MSRFDPKYSANELEGIFMGWGASCAITALLMFGVGCTVGSCTMKQHVVTQGYGEWVPGSDGGPVFRLKNKANPQEQ